MPLGIVCSMIAVLLSLIVDYSQLRFAIAHTAAHSPVICHNLA